MAVNVKTLTGATMEFPVEEGVTVKDFKVMLTAHLGITESFAL
jgi:hypothetical protein